MCSRKSIDRRVRWRSAGYFRLSWRRTFRNRLGTLLEAV
ncbi:hypothetical protein EVA_09402 [gut metagenome]|uniref:Uncharacterized protein n=1 Tax=gut metagenome TaxID=749906 RepID=J9CQQ7_9ZZZZ